MARSTATSVDEYLATLPDDRREIIAGMRDLIRRNLPAGYRESMNWGMISYEIPLERYGKTYNGQPLLYAGLASQKNHCALYLMGVYQGAQPAAILKAAFEKAGKRLDMGKSCIRFRTLDDLPLDVIADLVAGTPVDALISCYEQNRR